MARVAAEIIQKFNEAQTAEDAIHEVLIANKFDHLIPGRCPECGIFGELRFNITTGETDCVDCGATWGVGEAITRKE